jgi:hypothetical protein
MSDPLTDPPPPPANPPPTIPPAQLPFPPLGPVVVPPLPPPPPPDPPLVIQRYFSPGTLGFYSNEVNAAPVPPDAVVITEALWQFLLTENALGKTIVFDVPTQLPVAVVLGVTLQAVQAKYLSLLRATDWTQLGDTPVTIINEFEIYRDELRTLITNLPPDLNTIVWPILPTIVDPAYNRYFPP